MVSKKPLADRTPRVSGMSDRERECFNFYRSFLAQHGKPPTYRQIGDKLGTWPNTAFYLVQSLKRKGFLEHREITAVRLVLSEKGRKA